MLIKLLFSTKILFSKKEIINFIFIFALLIFCVIAELLSISFLIPVVYTMVEPQSSASIPFLEKFRIFFGEDSFFLKNIIINFFLIYILKNILLIYFYKKVSKFSEYLRLNLSSKLFNYYLQISYIEFIKKNSALMLRNIFDEVIAISVFITSFLNLIVEILIFLVILIVLFYFNYEITLYSLSTILFLLGCFFFILRNKLKIWGENKKNFTGKFLKTSLQSFNSIKELKIYNKEKFFSDNYFSDKSKAVDSAYLHRFTSILPRYVFEIFIIIIFSLIFLITNLKFNSSELIILAGVYGYSFYRLLPTANKIFLNYSNMKFRSPSVKNILEEFKNARSSELSEKFLKKKTKLNINRFEKMEIRNLNFNYKKNAKILTNINFEIMKNEIIGIYGESGSGKTTLINIILGLLKPINGQIIYNNNLEFLSDKHSVSEITSCVFQSVELWDATIKENIALGINDNQINNKILKNVIKQSKLEKFVNSLENGINTRVGDKGVNLSGGQKQRIGLARALYFQPKLLILDEATNSLDKETENEIMMDIIDLANKDLSIILISHDLKLLENYCNKIYQLSNNKLILKKN